MRIDMTGICVLFMIPLACVYILYCNMIYARIDDKVMQIGIFDVLQQLCMHAGV